MNRSIRIWQRLILFVLAAAAAIPAAEAAEVAGVPRDSNFNNTGGYDGTRIEAQLVVPVNDDTRVVHFIRDNNDPRVVTKCYLLKNVDAYEFRDYIRQMVQAKRVGNTALQQLYPGNTTTVPAAATASSAALVTPATAQPGYSPALQLGSNTAVECLKYVDGTGLLIISAEEYRFRDHQNGMGFDSLVAFLDKPGMGSSFGTQTFFYIPKFVPARNLKPLIENVGMNVTDVTEVWQGMDLVACDPELNWLLFDVVNFSQRNIEKMLEKYDVPIPEVKLTITVYELVRENDDRIGVDFQAWKNNGGIDFFSVGGRYRDNWSASYGGGLTASGSERTSFYNFNPKWNTRYIDFLTAIGRAEVLHSGSLRIRNNTPASLSRTTRIFTIDKTQKPPNALDFPDRGVGPYELLSALLDRVIPSDDDYPVAKANRQTVTASGEFGFKLTVGNASVNLDETRFEISLANTSLIGFNSDGSPRISDCGVVKQSVSLPHGRGRFAIGGLRKQNVVRSKGRFPLLKDIPYLGYLFSTESTSIKNSELIVFGECEWAAPPANTFLQGRSRPSRR